MLRRLFLGSQFSSELLPDLVLPALTAPSKDKQHDQEQIQMIATAIGIPRPSAPKIAGTNSESSWCRTPNDDMTFLLGAPRALLAPKMNDQSRLGTAVRGDSL